MRFLYYTNDENSNERLMSFISEINDRHKDKRVTYQIEIKRNRPKRSKKQNGYYRVCLEAIATHTGYTADQLHMMYKKKFNSTLVFDELIPETTTELDTKEFTAYLNKVKTHAKDFFHLELPDPTDHRYDIWSKSVKDYYDQMFASI